jgi:hypothetical protein
MGSERREAAAVVENEPEDLDEQRQSEGVGSSAEQGPSETIQETRGSLGGGGAWRTDCGDELGQGQSE